MRFDLRGYVMGALSVIAPFMTIASILIYITIQDPRFAASAIGAGAVSALVLIERRRGKISQLRREITGDDTEELKS